jgi:hypothetical protein
MGNVSKANKMIDESATGYGANSERERKVVALCIFLSVNRNLM